MSVLLLVVELLSILVLAASTSISMPGCVDRCGDVKIPYPFGIGPSCYHNKSYEILCDASFHPAKPYLASFNLEVLEITWPFQWEVESNSQTLTVNIPPRDVCDKQPVSSYDFRGSPYRYSRWLNDLVVEGCGAGVVVKDKSGKILTGCASICADDASNSMNETGCYGVGCCQASVMSSPKGSLLIMEDGLELYQVGLDSAPLLSSSNSCRTTATLIKRDTVRKFVEKSSNLQTFPTVLEWWATYKSSFKDSDSFSYYNATSLSLQRRCNFPYQGNPYVPYGCQVIEECRGCSHRCSKDNNPTGSGSHYHCKKNHLLKWATITGRYLRTDPRSDVESADDLSLTVALQSPNLCDQNGSAKEVDSYNFGDSPYRFSRWYNVFMVEGCGGSVVLKTRSGDILTGCASVCPSDAAKKNRSSCYGVGCCQASLLSSPTSDFIENDPTGDLDFYKIALDEKLPNTNSCNISATLISSKSVKKFAGKLSSLQSFPTVLEWRGIYTSSYKHDNFTCYYDQNNSPQCYCAFPYEGNPFLPYGCQVVQECHKCKHRCTTIFKNPPELGSFYGCEKNQLLRRASIIGFSSGMGLVLLVLGSYWLYRYLRKRKAIKQKAKYFKRNGGLLLQQQMSSNEGTVERTKVFTVAELEKATDNFNENRILGQGGQGTVYKGMLMDGRIVAIKKSKRVDETQVEPFINEVVILSQINHRNVVGLLGCCLETEVPTLVYEFIPNGTLYQHINGEGEEFHINWKMRLQIAAESAGAIAYLHSSSSAPIYHRDIKSSNILLDEKYRAKVSDFGTSRSITIEQTHVTTAVQGTYGYLDPEYFQSNQFTEKSDVYSFGVVLVELLTGKKPICPTGNGGWISLAAEFLSKMEDSRLHDILDNSILDESKENEFMAVAELARKCLNMNGKHRPTMKELAVQLDAIRSSQMPIMKGQRPAEDNDALIEMIHFDSSPFSRSAFPPDDDPPACSIEIQPLSST